MLGEKCLEHYAKYVKVNSIIPEHVFGNESEEDLSKYVNFHSSNIYTPGGNPIKEN